MNITRSIGSKELLILRYLHSLGDDHTKIIPLRDRYEARTKTLTYPPSSSVIRASFAQVSIDRAAIVTWTDLG